jgi:NAD-dependent SIR2 family protein deacetylase
MLKDKKKILVLTGAGMSAASGIPTFRGTNGFWNKEKVEVGSKEES